MPQQLFVLLCCLLGLIDQAGAPAPAPEQHPSPPKITLQAISPKIIDGMPTQLALTIEPQSALQNIVLRIVPPPGFDIDRSTLTIPNLSGKVTELFTVQSKKGRQPNSGGFLLASLERPQGNGKQVEQITSEKLQLDYVPEIPVTSYVWLGILGVALGYLLRLLLKVLQSIPPEDRPQPDPEKPAKQPGPFTRLVKEHYYLTDFLVTLGLGFIALIAMTKGNHPPDTGNLWYTALAVGVGIGLLTNSELLTKAGAR
jgi:hypothetical protein